MNRNKPNRTTAIRTKDEVFPVDRESRICFAIAWFASEADAAKWAKDHPGTYNGGWYHGRPTGRDHNFDRTLADGTKLYAVTY